MQNIFSKSEKYCIKHVKESVETMNLQKNQLEKLG